MEIFLFLNYKMFLKCKCAKEIMVKKYWGINALFFVLIQEFYLPTLSGSELPVAEDHLMQYSSTIWQRIEQENLGRTGPT